MAKVTVGIINYNSKECLKKCIDSVLKQTHRDIQIIFLDNNSKDGSIKLVKSLFKEKVEIVESKKNLGYAEGANVVIRNAIGKYVLIMNPDVVLEPNFIEIIYNKSEEDESIGSITGKLLRYDFKNNKKLKIIDSAGLKMYRTRRCLDIGQDEDDTGQYNEEKIVFGACGAAAFYRKSALENIRIKDEYFDEDFFAYKEDVDLSLRLNLYGYKCLYVPSAVGYHGRGFGGSKGSVNDYLNNRKSQSDFLKNLSYRNHHLMILKTKGNYAYRRDLIFIWYWIIAYFLYSLIFERSNLKAIKEIKVLMIKMKEKNKIVNSNIKKVDWSFIE